jgi:hypothetical protein
VKPRDAALVVAVLVVGGLAAADAVRNRGDETDRQRVPGRTSTAPSPPPEPVSLSADETTAVPAGGRLVFADARDCRLREGSLERGAERILPLVGTSCDLWAPWAGDRVAFGAPQSADALAIVAFVDLDRPDEIVGGTGSFGPVAWSRGGERAAWCDSATSGWERDFEREEVTPLAFCPRAYLAGDTLAWTRDRELLVGAGRVVATTAGHIEQVVAGEDGSFALVLEGGRIERRDVRGRTYGVRLPADALAATLVFSRDTCAAAAVGRGTVSVLDLGCFRGRGQIATVSTDNCTDRREGPTFACSRYPAPRAFPGRAAAWSPDGRWLAVAELRAIAFHRVVGGYRALRWPAAAADVAWLE